MQWKPISGYEGYYEVSDSGEVRSVNRSVVDKNDKVRRLSGKDMKLTRSKGRNGNGYYVVNLRNGKSKVVPVHVLVAKEFIPNPLCLPTVNHIDGDKSNNSVGNLEWASYRDNNIHALRHSLREPRGSVVVQEDFDGKTVGVFKSVCMASRETGIGRCSISHYINHRINSAGGFIWRKISEGVTTISRESTPGIELPAEAQDRLMPKI